MHCECGVHIATTNQFCFLRFISTGKTWMSLRQWRIAIILDGISQFTYTSNPPVISHSRKYIFRRRSSKTWTIKLYCWERAIKFCFTNCKKINLRTSNSDKASIWQTNLFRIFYWRVLSFLFSSQYEYLVSV